MASLLLASTSTKMTIRSQESLHGVCIRDGAYESKGNLQRQATRKIAKKWFICIYKRLWQTAFIGLYIFYDSCWCPSMCLMRVYVTSMPLMKMFSTRYACCNSESWLGFRGNCSRSSDSFLSCVFSWISGYICTTCRLANITHTYKKGSN